VWRADGRARARTRVRARASACACCAAWADVCVHVSVAPPHFDTFGRLRYGGIDAEFCGSTSSTACITSDHVVFANLGDSRALLSSGGQVVFATSDHKPEDPSEKDRICDAGGYVLRGRVNGCLAVARAFGDFQFKDQNADQPLQMVSPCPDITFVDRNHDDDEFVLICCDGIFDVMTSEDAATFVRDTFEDDDVCQRVRPWNMRTASMRVLTLNQCFAST
jgi:serine/threonine protein phosphatase PrpC